MSSRLRLSSSARLPQSCPGRLISGVWEEAKPATILAIQNHPLFSRLSIGPRLRGYRGGLRCENVLEVVHAEHVAAQDQLALVLGHAFEVALDGFARLGKR